MADVAKQRILVVGINYAPEHAGIAPYTTGLCEELVRQGHEVLVLAGLPSYPSWIVPARYRRRLRTDELINGVRVRRLWHYVPKRQTALRRGVYELTYALHVRASRIPWRPDVVLTVVPALLGGLAASSIARRRRAPLAVWVQDMMGPAAEQSGIEGGARVAKFARRAERRLLRSADRIAVIHDAFADYVEAEGVDRARITTVRNWSHIKPPSRARAEVRALMGWPDSTIIALHTGNMGAKQALENVVEAARLADVDGHDVRFVLMGDGSRRAALAEMARGLRTIEIVPPVSDDLYSDVLAAADVLLVNERASAVEMSLPSKLTSYRMAGTLIVAAVSPQAVTAEELAAWPRASIGPADEPEWLVSAVRAARPSGCGEAPVGDPGMSVESAASWLVASTQSLSAPSGSLQ